MSCKRRESIDRDSVRRNERADVAHDPRRAASADEGSELRAELGRVDAIDRTADHHDDRARFASGQPRKDRARGQNPSR